MPSNVSMNPGELNREYLIRESIKEQIITELLGQKKYNLSPGVYQRAMEEARKELLQEIGKLRQMQDKVGEIHDPFVRDVVKTVLHEPGAAGYIEEIIEKLDEQTRSKIQSWLSFFGKGQGKGFLYGVGLAALIGVLLPGNGRKVKSTAYKTPKEGMEIIERIRSIAAKLKEELEDIMAEASFNRLQQEMNAEFQASETSSFREGRERIYH